MSIVAKKIMMGSGAVASPSDSEFNRVSFLSHFDGSNDGVNSQFTDASASNHTITANGNVTQGSFGPFARPDGEWGVSFDGAGDYLTINEGATGGSGNWTIEMFINPSDVSSGEFGTLLDNRPDSTNGLYQTLVLDAATLKFYVGGTGASYRITSGDALTANTWFHVALCKSGSSTKLFIDGTQTGSTFTDNVTYADNNRTLIGAEVTFGSGIGEFFAGQISNFRTVNSALYTSNFTAPTSKLTAVSNTAILTCQSNRFVDNSGNAHTVTPYGNSAVTAFGPFLSSSVYDPAVNGASASFDGTGDSLAIASSADFALGTGDFTVEFWVYHREKTTDTYFDYRSASNQSALLLWIYGDTGAIQLNIAGVTRAFTPPSLLNRWAHIVIARSSGTTKTFVDGTQYLSFSDSTDYIQGSTFYISRFYGSDSESVNGYICDFRWVKGTAVYTGNFTPPTAPLTAITNTKLLLNMADGQAIDSTAQNNLTLYGTAKTSTAQKKFGTSSLLLDGNSDYVAIPAINLTGSFTMEFFAYLNAWPNSSNFDMFYGEASSIYMCFTSGINGSGSDRSIQLAYEPSGYSTIVQFNVNSAMNSGAWHHVAITKNSSNLNVCYIDGTAVPATNATGANTFSTTGTHFIGRGYNPSYHYFGGYIDDFRISQSVRYTANFSPPTEAFPDKGQ